MVYLINNAIDILWLIIGLISIIVILAMFMPWSFIKEFVFLTLAVIWIVMKYFVIKAWITFKKVFRKRRTWVEINDPHLFI